MSAACPAALAATAWVAELNATKNASPAVEISTPPCALHTPRNNEWWEADPIEDYLAALALLEGVVGDVDVAVPGHRSACGADQLRARIDQDRAYVRALRVANPFSDSRVGPHERQRQNVVRRREADGTSE